MTTKVPGKKRFFYHYYKQKGCMTVHWEGACHPVKDIKLYNITLCETKWQERQPRIVMQGWASSVRIKGDIAEIWG